MPTGTPISLYMGQNSNTYDMDEQQNQYLLSPRPWTILSVFISGVGGGGYM